MKKHLIIFVVSSILAQQTHTMDCDNSATFQQAFINTFGSQMFDQFQEFISQNNLQGLINYSIIGKDAHINCLAIAPHIQDQNAMRICLLRKTIKSLQGHVKTINVVSNGDLEETKVLKKAGFRIASTKEPLYQLTF